MKKISCITLLSIFILFLDVHFSYGQHALFLGAKGGISIPNLSSSSSENTSCTEGFSSRIGANYGILGELKFTPHFSLQAEIDYIGEGGKRKGIQPISVPDKYLDAFQEALNTDQTDVYANLKNTSKINYLQIPIMAKLNFPLTTNHKLNFFIQAGPYISFLLSAKQYITSHHIEVYSEYNHGKGGGIHFPETAVKQFFGSALDTTVQAKNDLHKTNFGIQGNLGFSYVIGPGKVFLQGGGNYGLIDVQKIDNHGRSHIGAATINLGYSFDIRKIK